MTSIPYNENLIFGSFSRYSFPSQNYRRRGRHKGEVLVLALVFVLVFDSDIGISISMGIITQVKDQRRNIDVDVVSP